MMIEAIFSPRYGTTGHCASGTEMRYLALYCALGPVFLGRQYAPRDDSLLLLKATEYRNCHVSVHQYADWGWGRLYWPH
jgi:hypothetical protein